MRLQQSPNASGSPNTAVAWHPNMAASDKATLCAPLRSADTNALTRIVLTILDDRPKRPKRPKRAAVNRGAETTPLRSMITKLMTTQRLWRCGAGLLARRGALRDRIYALRAVLIDARGLYKSALDASQWSQRQAKRGERAWPHLAHRTKELRSPPKECHPMTANRIASTSLTNNRADTGADNLLRLADALSASSNWQTGVARTRTQSNKVAQAFTTPGPLSGKVSLNTAPRVPNGVYSNRFAENIFQSDNSQIAAAKVNIKSESKPKSDRYSSIRFPWDPKVITPSPAKRNAEQIKKDFLSLNNGKAWGVDWGKVWGTVAAEPSTRNFTYDVFRHSLRDSHGRLPLPNTNDDISTMLEGKYLGKKIDNSAEHLNDLKAIALRAANVGRLISPEAAASMLHYLGATGKPLERAVDRGFWKTQENELDSTNIDKYLGELEKSALRYAIDHPTVTEFTIQGPLFSLRHQNSKDLWAAMGSFYAGGRAHYKINRGSDGRITLDGSTQMFGIDHYNFRHDVHGVGMPALPFEKISEVAQHYLQAMSLVKHKGQPIAKSFEQTFLEKPGKSYITNKP